MDNKHRIDVTVLARHGLDGSITPIAVKLSDGRRFSIDGIDGEPFQAASRKAGGQGTCYKCHVNDNELLLFHDDVQELWFFEV